MSRYLPPPPLSLEPSVSTEWTQIRHGKCVAGQYQVGGVIGVGTYGEVRYGVSLSSGERVAIKIVDLARFPPETAALMRKEISILRMLDHPHCIRIIAVHENVPFSGKWCEACACTCFTPPTAHPQQEQQSQSRSLQQAQQQHDDESQPVESAERIHVTSTTLCAICAHAAAEHSSVKYTYDDAPFGRAVNDTGVAAAAGADHNHHHDHSRPHEPGSDDGDGESREVMLIVQELAAGGELFSLLSHSGPLPEDIARYYFQQMIEGVAHMHSRGVVHRDLKPENLVLTENFQLRIIDFGLAASAIPLHQLDTTRNNMTHNAQQYADIRHYSGVGSQPYSAPEVYYQRELYQGRGYRGGPADIWSCAVVLFVMLSGRPPFVRPLAKTYGAHMRRCRHFVNIISGTGLDHLNPHAKDLLQRMFRLAPSERLTLEEVRSHPFFLGPVPTPEELGKVMEERVMKAWSNSHNEMSSVLSKMRSSLPRGPASTSNTPSLAGRTAMTPSGSPGLPSMTFHSPSFSASVPPSPYVPAHAHPNARAQSPESHDRRFLDSPASFNHTPTHALTHTNQATLLSPTAQATTVPVSVVPPRHVDMHHTTDTAIRAHTPPHHPHTIAAAIHASNRESILNNNQRTCTAAVDVAMLQMRLEENNSSNTDEIPPPRPPSAPPSPHTPPRVAESKQEEHCRRHLVEAERRGRLQAQAQAMRAAALHRHASVDRPTSAIPVPPCPSVDPSLLLASSFSFPPRHPLHHFTSTLDYSNLVEIIENRLTKRAFKHQHIPRSPHPKYANVSPKPTHKSHARTDAQSTSPRSRARAASVSDDDGDECIIQASGFFSGATIVALISIGPLQHTAGSKGRLVVAQKLSCTHGEPVFAAWAETTIAAGLRED